MGLATRLPRTIVLPQTVAGALTTLWLQRIGMVHVSELEQTDRLCTRHPWINLRYGRARDHGLGIKERL